MTGPAFVIKFQDSQFNSQKQSQKVKVEVRVQACSPPSFRAMEPPQLSVTVLGAGQEVGRSCCVLKYRGKTVVCDAGVHPAHHGIASLPFLDELDWSTVDVLLITQ